MSKSNNQWDIKHLGEMYFKNIGHKAAGKYSLDVPIKLVYIGKTGETYDTPNTNPNWSAEMDDGKIFRFNSTKNKIVGEEHWNPDHCFIFYWGSVKKKLFCS